MERRTISAAAVAATLVVAATALVTTSSSMEGETSLDAAHRPGTAVGRHYAHGTAPLPGPGTAAVSPGQPLALGGGAPLLRPDVFSLRARNIQMRVRGERRVLRFASMLANRGPGPMLVRPRPRRHCPPGQRLARQLLYVDRNRDGRFQRRTDTATRSRSAGCMVDHPTHGHWHFDAMASYRLFDTRPRRRVSARPKVSFCLRDNQPIPRTRPRQRRAYYGECGRNLVQGISPGWVDLYDVNTPGQSLRIPRRLPNGVYCLVLRADPRDQLLETNEGNNARARAVRIRGTRVSTPRTSACRDVVR